MKLNALAILIAAAAATAVPTETKYEAALAASPVADQPTPLPEFVSSKNLNQFLSASRETTSALPGTREAAEALSDRFAENRVAIIRVARLEPIPPRKPDPASDPKVSAISQPGTHASAVPDPTKRKVRIAAKTKSAKVKAKIVKRASAKPTVRTRLAKPISKKAHAAPSKKRVVQQHRRKLPVAKAARADVNNEELRLADARHAARPHLRFVDLLGNPALWN
jgi:hypothetical protein